VTGVTARHGQDQVPREESSSQSTPRLLQRIPAPAVCVSVDTGVESFGQVVAQVKGCFQCDEVQFRNGSTRIRIDYRWEVTTVADGVFVKGFKQNVQASRIHGRDSGQVYRKMGVLIAARFGAHISKTVLCPCLSCRSWCRLLCRAEVELVSL
jgi:hypothetical protein